MTPLSEAQRAFWLEELLMQDGGARATLAFGLDIAPRVDAERLDQALTAVVKRHPLLRARIVAQPDDEPCLRIEPAPDSILTRLPNDGWALDAWCRQPVSATTWPPCQAALALGDGVARVRIAVHHGVFDGESKDVFLRDLADAYANPDAWAEMTPRFDAPFWRALVQRERVAGGAHAFERGPRQPPRATEADAESVEFAAEPELCAIVAATAKRLGVSKFTVHLAAWHAALARLQLDGDVVTPIAFSTRLDSDVGEIGPFVNLLRVRSTTPRTKSFRTVALELAQAVRRCAANRHERSLACDRGDGHTTISYRREGLAGFAWPGASATPVLLPPQHTASADVAIRMLQRELTASGMVDVDRGVLPSGHAERLVRCWRALLHAGAHRLDTRIGELSLLETR